jgi:hypothetical protein
MTAPIRSMPELVDAIRARRDELNISHETIDNIAGLQSGYTSKLLGPIQLKGFSHMSLGAVLGALAMGLMPVEDVEQRAKVEGRWQKRKRPQKLLASASMLKPQKTQQESDQMSRKQKLQMWGRMGGKASGKRRMKTMKKRARQAAASYAARARWAKRAAIERAP